MKEIHRYFETTNSTVQKPRSGRRCIQAALGLNFSPNICRFCSRWTLQKNVWNPKAVRLAVSKSIQRRLLQAASWEGIQMCCHTALPNFPTISREKISLDLIFWFTLSFGEFESGNRYYNHKRKKEKNIDYTNNVGYWRWKRKWGRHILKRLQYAMSCSLHWVTQEYINIFTGYIRSQPPTVTRSDSHVAAPRRHGDGGAWENYLLADLPLEWRRL